MRDGVVASASSLMLAAVGGALLLAAVVVAPVSFSVLANDHVLAGQVAGEVFSITYEAAAVIALFALISAWAQRLVRVLIALALVMALLLACWMVPLVRAHGTGWPFSFASLHMTAGALHLVLMLLMLAASWLVRTGPGASRA